MQTVVSIYLTGERGWGQRPGLQAGEEVTGKNVNLLVDGIPQLVLLMGDSNPNDSTFIHLAFANIYPGFDP